MNIPQQLQHGLKQLKLSPNIADKLIHYIKLLQQWQRVYNLTAITDPQQMISKHLFDSLSIHPYLKGSNCLDLGSGAGLPGIPLALALPNMPFSLLDSSQKKCLFLNQVKIELELDNVSIIQKRAQQYQPLSLFDTIVSRAFADLKNMVSCSRHLLKVDGRWLAMKAQKWTEEINELPTTSKVTATHELTVPRLNAKRQLIVMKLFDEK